MLQQFFKPNENFKYCLFSVRSVMYKYLEKENELSFHNIFNQIIGTIPLYFTVMSLQIYLNIFL